MAKKFKLPQGVVDYLPNECYAKSKIEDSLIDCYKEYGYSQIDTPTLERYDLFESGVGKVSLKKLFKLTDIDGDLLVLRPDMTMPISRIVSTKLAGNSYKFSYRGRVFSMLEDSGKLREYTQVGVEVMGSKGNGVDVEVVMLAIKSLLDIGLEDFQIELGHVGFFKGLLSSMQLTLEEVDELVDLVEKKDAIGEQVFAQRVGLSDDKMNLILKLPMLFGGIEVLDEAKALCFNDEMTKAIDNLRAVYQGVKELGFDKYVTFDLSVVGKMKYYSGMIMKGIAKSFGRPFLSGGRYDNLCDAFGKNVPAIGFAVYVGYLLTVLESEGKTPEMNQPEVIVGFECDQMDAANKMVEDYKAKGVYAIKSFAITIEQLEKCKIIAGAKKAIYVQNGKTVEV